MSTPVAQANSHHYATDDARWEAVVRRDAAADGRFFTCVHSTGIFCRPNCAARTPNRKNVSFVQSAVEALRAGFRPCKRCRPDDPAAANAYLVDAVARACELIESAEVTPALDELATSAGMSRFHFHRVFKQVTGVTPRAYANAHRAERMRHALKHTPTMTDAIYESGAASNGRFYSEATKNLGMTPRAYRAGAANETIRATIAQSSLGGVLVAATERGVCTIMLGEDSDTLWAELRDRFPHATLTEADETLASSVESVVRYIEEPAESLDLPLDIRGTAFQQRVWQELRNIPCGGTVTYSQLAKRIGSPRAARAVASACARNEIAVAIPCHRVVAKDGSLAGYRWGTHRKRLLLDRESTS